MFLKLAILFIIFCISKVITANDVLEQASNRHQRSHSKLDPNFICPLREGRFPRSKDCRSFHRCNDGVAKLVLCPPYTLYDVRLRACFFSSYATCFVDEPFTCPTANGSFRNDQCDRYFLCRGGVSFLRHCPYLSKFDTSVKRCVIAMYANCDDLVTKNDTSTPTTIPISITFGLTTTLRSTNSSSTTVLTTITTDSEKSSTLGGNSTTVLTVDTSTQEPTLILTSTLDPTTTGSSTTAADVTTQNMTSIF